MTKEMAKHNLFDYADTLESLGIVFWLDGGTLLGAYRDKDFCQDDHDDIDLFTWDNYSNLIPEIIRINQEKGFEIKNHWKGDRRTPLKGQELAMARMDLKIDLNFISKRGNDAWGCVFMSPKDSEGFSPCTPQVSLAKFYEELQPYEFLGRIFNIPRDIEAYLTHRYGDWKTKRHRSNYSWQNPDHLRALKPDYPFYENNS